MLRPAAEDPTGPATTARRLICLQPELSITLSPKALKRVLGSSAVEIRSDADIGWITLEGHSCRDERCSFDIASLAIGSR